MALRVATDTIGQVRQMIERQKQSYGWEFIFLGANMDAVTIAGCMGIGQDRAVSYHSDHEGTQLNYSVVCDAICAMRTHDSISDDWADNIREDYEKRKLWGIYITKT